MMRSAVALAIVAIVALAAIAAQATTLTSPTVISSTSSTWSASMTVQLATFTEAANTPAAVSYVSRQFCYLGTCSVPGPTIHLKPGDTFVLTVTNTLAPDTGTVVMNTMHSPNTTNIHTHGLHIDPFVDDVFLSIPGGSSRTYTYVIPSDHAPGLHWYHSHYHGSVAFQVMGGLFGAIIIDPSSNTASQNLPSSLTTLIANSQLVVFHQFIGAQVLVNGVPSQGCSPAATCTTFQPNCPTPAPSTASFDPFRFYTYTELSNEVGNAVAPAITFGGGTAINLWMVNGMYGGTATGKVTIAMTVGQPKLIRMLNAAGTDSMVIGLSSTSCTATQIANDGVYRTAATPKTTFFLGQAARTEIVYTCTAVGTYNVVYKGAILFTLAVTASVGTGVTPTTAQMAAIIPPGYLKSLLNTKPNDTTQWSLVQARQPAICQWWIGGAGSDCSYIQSLAPNTNQTTLARCPFQVFAGSRRPSLGTAPSAYQYVTATGRVNEWTLYGDGNAQHPWHLHVHHFQVISYTAQGSTSPAPGSTPTDVLTVGEWRDTIPLFQGALVIRIPFASMPGETMMHCHFLRHADIGMMASFYVCDGTGNDGVELCPKLILSHDTKLSLSTATSACNVAPTLSATLQGSLSAVAIVGRTVTLTATIGTTTYSCTGVTSSSGVASCTPSGITTVAAGTYVTGASFLTGSGIWKPSSALASTWTVSC